MLQYLCYASMALGVLVIALGDWFTGGVLLVVGIGMHFAMGH